MNKSSPRKSHVTQRASIFDQDVKKPTAPKKNVLSSLRVTQIVALKPSLPIELISVILDHVPPAGLIRCAQVSRKLKEVVYDDSRWVIRLRRMGVWDELDARRHQEETLRKRFEAQQQQQQLYGGRSSAVSRGAAAQNGYGAHNTLFDVEVETGRQTAVQRRVSRPLADGFDDLVLTAGNAALADSGGRDRYEDAVDALRNTRSVRGQARREYGRIHRALNGLYLDAADPEHATNPLVFSHFRDSAQQAQVLANLAKFALADDASGWQDREERLRQVTETFRNRATNDFLAAYHDRDVARMRQCVSVATTLDGGQHIVDVYADSHPLVVGTQRLANPLDCVEGVTAGHVGLTPSQRFFEHLAEIFQEQAFEIDQIFPSTLDALTPFLEKVTEKVIRPFVDAVLSATEKAGDETYLMAVSGVFEQSMRFAVSLQPTQASPPTYAQNAQSTLLKCFDGYIDAYLAKELENFQAKAQEEVLHWERDLSEQETRNETFYMSNVNRQAAKRDFLSSFKKVVMMPVNVVAAFPLPGVSTKSATQEAPVAISANKSSGTSTRGSLGDAPTTELAAKAAIMNSRLEGIKSLFSIELALNLVQHAKSAIERMAIFARHGGDFSARASRQCETIFITLVDILGQRHIKSGFDKAVNHLSTYNPRQAKEIQSSDGDKTDGSVEPLVTFLELVNVGDLIQQMIDVFYAQELVAARLTDRDDFLNPATKQKKAFEQMLDERVAAGMSKGIDVLIDEVEYVCATTQLATDFNPGVVEANPGAGSVFDIGPTLAAKRVVALVEGHTGMLVGGTEKTMLDVFFQEVGLRLFGVLCKHIKRQRISVDGAIKLISDINLYASFAASLKQKPLTPYFTALRELSQIYLVECVVPSSSSPHLSSSSSSSPRLPSSSEQKKSKAKKSSSSSYVLGGGAAAGSGQVDSSRAKELALIIADNERYRGVFGADEVLEFAARRADWFAVRGEVERAMYGIGCVVM